MKFLLDTLMDSPEYVSVLEKIKQNNDVAIVGPSDSQKAFLCSGITEHTGLKSIFIAFNELEARKVYQDLAFFYEEEVLYFPPRDILLYRLLSKSREGVFERISALINIIRGEYRIVVIPVEALFSVITPKSIFLQNIAVIKTGDNHSIDSISEKLLSTGYERVFNVESKGCFAVRGGIVDVYSVDRENPIRIEFFGDQVDSIREFDKNTQRSTVGLDSVVIPPASELLLTPGKRDEIIYRIKIDLEEHFKYLAKKDIEMAKSLKHFINQDIEALEQGGDFPGIDRYLSYTGYGYRGILDYFDKETNLVFIDNPSRIEQKIEAIAFEKNEICKNLLEKGHIIPQNCPDTITSDEFACITKKRTGIIINSLMNTKNTICKADYSFSIQFKSLTSYHGNSGLLEKDIEYWKKNSYRAVILSGAEGRGKYLENALRSKDIEVLYMVNPSGALMYGQVYIMPGSLDRGFEFPEGRLIVTGEIQTGETRQKKHKRKPSKGVRLELFTDLKTGDYVVHQFHGIGIYAGVEQLVVQDVKRDYLKIKYLDSDFLYIPVNQLDLIQKYIGPEGRTPRLNRLGGSEWNKTRSKVRESLKKIAEGLIELYAKRQSLKGYAFSKDTFWQRQFEDIFPYEETDDQLKAIAEIKKDMESQRPIERILCGDVGYGKTEVAARAAFKAVMDGKQVAWLVPTTVLAQQHYNTLRERMKDFPVSIEMISRFRTKGEQKKILSDIKNGMMDILIGTHRLLQKDISFKDLGLLVVDEEQRFGVEHKERIKNLSPEIDVLTLTATPIPRTLHMSLTGIRDISVIEQPPEDRIPVQTYVMEYDEDIVREAVIKELSRKGQVFYLYNRVNSIEFKAERIKHLLPEARVVSAHGQMDEKRLEEVMMSFIEGKADVLVCTTIIESGLDMPNVNTIIVEDADKMGLSQLYQLRGRVGRSNRLAYAYITYKKDKVISEVAEKRLQAIKEFTGFGSGFKIAMRDLEIRGAGNLLGPEQHGNIATVGYDMYCRLLEQAIKELKGESKEAEIPEVLIDLKVNAFIDTQYINEESSKIEIYKKIASVTDEADAIDVLDEMTDRFGEPDESARNLLTISVIKVLAREEGFVYINEKDGKIIFKVGKMITDLPVILGKLQSKYKGKLLFNAGNNPHIMFRPESNEAQVKLKNIKILLQDIKNLQG